MRVLLHIGCLLSLAFGMDIPHAAADGTSAPSALLPPTNITLLGPLTSRWQTATVQTSVAPATLTPTGGAHSWADTEGGTGLGSNLTVMVPGRHQLSFVTPKGMVFIPAGPFKMGAGYVGTFFTDAPVHTVQVDALYMDLWEISGAKWDEVRQWGLTRGYSDLRKGLAGCTPKGGAAGPSHPIVQITWYDGVKWCNARSEMEGLTPVYYADRAQLTVYRTGALNVSNEWVDWQANGYRLPTEAEWEKAARGGLTDAYYAWGNELNGARANYYDSGDPFDNGTTPVGYYNGLHTVRGAAVGASMANNYGLHDMVGNVYEWCWDWYGPLGAGAADNPIGPREGAQRTIRSGSWKTALPFSLFISRRAYKIPHTGDTAIGLRCVRRP